MRFAREKGVTLILVGQSRRSWWKRLRQGSVTHRLMKNTRGLDVLIVAFDAEQKDSRRPVTGTP